MNVALWIVAGLLALVFVLAGANKLLIPQERLARAPAGDGSTISAPAWLDSRRDRILGAAGVLLPAALDIAPVLVPLAAVGLATIMVGAAI